MIDVAERMKLIKQVLKPVVRIRADKAIGSGTIVSSTPENGTYLLTNHHVVEASVEYKQVWDELLRREIKKQFVKPVEVDIHRLDSSGDELGLISCLADIQICNKEQDMALLKLRDDQTYDSATMYPEGECKNIPLLVEICACGAATGEKPIVTFGHLNGKQKEIEHFEYWLGSAMTIFGNSGGAVFTPYVDPQTKEKNWRYIGIPSRIKVQFLGFSADAITHVGFFIPIFRIYDWLRENCYEFLWDPSVSVEECERRREQKREKELALHLARESGG